jgi:YYY domain-containing protein
MIFTNQVREASAPLRTSWSIRSSSLETSLLISHRRRKWQRVSKTIYGRTAQRFGLLPIVLALGLIGLCAGVLVFTRLFSGAKTLLLTPSQILADQQSPPFGAQFKADSFANTVPVFFWWLTILLVGLLAYPLIFGVLRNFADRGYVFGKTLGVLVVAYSAWMLANARLVAFSHLSLLIALGLLLVASIVGLTFQRQALLAFARQRWRLLLLEEALFTAAFLLFVGIRSLDPDLWAAYLGGEKPMEMAFLNAILRSPYMPPLDPWFAGGYINYYYYGYIVIAALIKLTGIAPVTAFNLAIPTLFALTFTGAFSLVYSLTKRVPFALLGGYFAALIGNFDGFVQVFGQLRAALSHVAVPLFDYWRSSRIIPYTINEFPFWSFLFADLHPHVINMPIVVFMLGILAALLMEEHSALLLSLLAAFVFGTLACINPWDMPVYALLLGVTLLLRSFFSTSSQAWRARLISLARALALFGGICALAYLLYWPFYASYQQLYVNGLGAVSTGTTLGDYLTIYDLWIFLALSFFLYELYRAWIVWERRVWKIWEGRPRGSPVQRRRERFDPGPCLCTGDPRGRPSHSNSRRVAGYLLLCGVALTLVALLGLKTLLIVLIGLGVFLFVVQGEVGTRYIYLLLLGGLCICLGIELVYVRDFLDGSVYERMNSVFKFSIQAWFCLEIGGALAAWYLWTHLQGFMRHAWLAVLALLITANSIFLPLGTLSRVGDHSAWIKTQPPAQSAAYIPTLDGSAFIRAWYPGDAQAIDWINANIAGSPVILEAASPYSFSWYGRVSVYTGLPDVLGWPDHVGEQRPNEQVLNRLVDVGIIYTTLDKNLALILLHAYHVRYIYVGDLERQTYAQQSSGGLDKFDAMVGSSLRIIYRANGVTLYEVLSP